MKRLKRLLSTLSFPEDVALIKKRASLLADTSDFDVQYLWRLYSDHFWGAGWINPGFTDIEHFVEWLEQDV